MYRRLCVLVVLVAMLGVTAYAVEPIQYVVHGSQDQVATYRAIFDRFTAETGIPVEIIHVGNQTEKWEKVLVNVAGGNSPDIVGGVSTEFGEYAMTGLLLPLDDLIERDGMDVHRLVPPFVEALQLNGSQYLLPYGSSLMTMVYNRDHFNEMGVQEPPLTWNSPEWTYDEFVEVAKKLTVGSGTDNITRYGVSGIYWDSWITLPYPWSGRWVTDDLKTFLGTEPEPIAALQSIQDLIHVHRVMPNVYGGTGFVNQQGAMGGVGTWTLNSLAQRPEINWSFMPWFRVKETTQGAIFPIGYGILATSTKIDAAWELIKYLTWNEDANREYAIAAGAIPSNLVNLAAWREHWEDVFGFDINIQVVIEQAVSHAAIIQIRKSPAFSAINPIMTQVSYDVIGNKKPAETAVREVADLIQTLLIQAAP